MMISDRIPQMDALKPNPATDDWPEPAPRFLRDGLHSPPILPLDDVLGLGLAQWVANAAEAKGAPADYVFAALLSVASATIGNSRWVTPWHGWNEPPLIWTMCIGLPSAGKSPAIDAVLQPLRDAERPLRADAEKALREWKQQEKLATIACDVWEAEVRAALKNGDTPPQMPDSASAGPSPHIPRLVVSDATIERLAVISSKQPRGTLQMRDELAGWLESMTRYSGGGTDRPFWIETYGGRDYTVERMGRDPVTVDRLSIGVMGSIQPDRLKTLLIKADDDGLLARFLPIWPNPAPVKRPGSWDDKPMIDRVLARLLSLDMVEDDHGNFTPQFLPLTERARCRMDKFRQAVRSWESTDDGLSLSFIGKLPGLAARLALVLAILDWAADGGEEPRKITRLQFGRAVRLIEGYFLPMARSAYSCASMPKCEIAARRLVGLIREKKWTNFSSREVQRSGRAGLSNKTDVELALATLEEGGCIRAAVRPPEAQGGRPPRTFDVNPALL